VGPIRRSVGSLQLSYPLSQTSSYATVKESSHKVKGSAYHQKLINLPSGGTQIGSLKHLKKVNDGRIFGVIVLSSTEKNVCCSFRWG